MSDDAQVQIEALKKRFESFLSTQAMLKKSTGGWTSIEEATTKLNWPERRVVKMAMYYILADVCEFNPDDAIDEFQFRKVVK